jgi:signal transduction histidine kinase
MSDNTAPGHGDSVARAAHDLNNICASLLGFTALLQETLPAGSSLAAYVNEILNAAQRVQGIGGRLQELAQEMRETT